MSRVLSWTIIYLGPALPQASSAQPERSAGHTIALLFAFAPEGACQATLLPGCWWSLTPPFQLFSYPPRRAVGVFFSAALSVGSPRPAVNRLPALWSPDFPHGASAPRDRLAHFASFIVTQHPFLHHPARIKWKSERLDGKRRAQTTLDSARELRVSASRSAPRVSLFLSLPHFV